jgi:hypothetical protein
MWPTKSSVYSVQQRGLARAVQARVQAVLAAKRRLRVVQDLFVRSASRDVPDFVHGVDYERFSGSDLWEIAVNVFAI